MPLFNPVCLLNKAAPSLCLFSTVFLLCTQSILAQSFTIENGQTVNTQQTLNNGETGLIKSGGTLDFAGAGAAVTAPGDNATLTNNGTITSGGALFNDAINSTGMNANIINNGTITTQGIASGGIEASGSNAVVNNNGSISTQGLQAEGIESIAASNVTISNSGTINTTGNGADGIESTGDNAAINNSGIIRTTGAPQAGVDDASGIETTGANGQVTNSGSIFVTGADASGVDLDAAGNSNNTLTNRGIISATGDANQAIVGGAGEQTVNLNNGSQINGDIDLGGGTDIINFGANTSSTLTILNTENINFAAGAIDGDTVFVVDPTGFAAIGTSVNALSNSIHQLIGQRLTQPQPLQPTQVASSKASPGLLFQEQKPLAWGNVFGESRRRGAEQENLAYDHDYFGFTGGYEFDVRRSRIGVFAGFSEGDIETQKSDSFDADVSSLFFGGYGRTNLGAVNLIGSLIFGFEDYDSDREVMDSTNGLETADADIDNFFISPSITLSSAFAYGAKFELRPSLSVSYIYADFDSYSESGTTQSDLDVDDRSVEFFNTRAQLAGAYMWRKNSEAELRIGIDTRHASEDDVDASIGNNINFDFDIDGDEDVLGGFVGGRMHMLTQTNLSLIADAEYRYAEGEEKDLAASLLLEYRF
jgi:hypothetical protein